MDRVPYPLEVHRRVRSLTLKLLILCLYVGPEASAQVGKLYPLDEAARQPESDSFPPRGSRT
jgi:hypothetical protein